MPIRVFDGAESFEGAIASQFSTMTAALQGEGSIPPSVDGQIERAFDSFTSSLSGTFTAPGGSFDWTHGLGPLRLSPPTLTSPTVVNTVALLQAGRTFRSGFSIIGDGLVNRFGNFSGNPSGDLLIDMRGVNHAEPYPIEIGRYVNVKIIGLHMDMVEQSTAHLASMGFPGSLGNEKWNLRNRNTETQIADFNRGRDLHEVDDSANVYFGNPGGYTSAFDSNRAPNKGWNIHPRMGGIAGAIQSQHSGILWIEGCYINANGLQGDIVIISNNTSGSTQTPELNATTCRMMSQNCRFENWEGQAYHKNYGDGIHGDSWQVQGGGRRHSFWFENSVWHSGQEGQVVTGNAGSNPPLSHMFNRNMQYVNLPKATNEINLNHYAQPGESSGGPVCGNRDATVAQEGAFPGGGWEIENIWTENKNSNIVSLNGERLAVGEHAEINAGLSPIDFAPIAELGSNYVSPH